MKGTFICFEGLDGSGKTTIANAVYSHFKKDCKNVAYVDKKGVKFPTGYLNKHMKTLKSILWDYELDDPLHELGDFHWLYLNSSWFSVLDEVIIRPLLQKSYIVIMDNWYFKLLARFKLKSDIDHAHVFSCFSHLSVPDITVFLDISPEVAAERKQTFSISETGNMDGFSGLTEENFINYQKLVRKNLIQVIDNPGKLTIKKKVDLLNQVQVTQDVLDSLPKNVYAQLVSRMI